MDNSPVVSLVIIDFFKAERVVDNVKLALKQKGDFSLQVVVIDNSCDPRNKRILEQLPKSDNVHVLYNNSNCGYVAACNEGVSLFSSDYVFLVNPDIAWKADTTISAILNKFDSDERIGVIGTRQINDDGSTPVTVRRFPDLIAQVARRTFLRKLPWFKQRVDHYEVGDFDYSRSQYCDWVQSSFMAIRRPLWDLIGGLNSNYFLFMSEPDFCYETWSRGRKVFYFAEVFVGADGKRCSAGGFKAIFTSKAMRFHIVDAMKYQFKFLFKRKIASENSQ